MIRRPPRSTQSRSSAASDVYKRQLRELARSGHALPVDHEGRQNLGVAVLSRMEIEHEVDERPLQPCAESPVEGETRPGDLCPAREIEDVQTLADLPVRPRREGE